MKKRLLALLLALVMVAAMIPASVFASEDLQTSSCCSGWTYDSVEYNDVRAIKATRFDGKEKQFLYAVVEDKVYDGVEAEVTYKVDKYNFFEVTTKTFVEDATGLNPDEYTDAFGDVNYDALNAWVEIQGQYMIKVSPVEVASYTAKFTVDGVKFVNPFNTQAWTNFQIVPMSILKDEILKDVEKSNFYLIGEEYDPALLFEKMNIFLQDSRIVKDDETYCVLEEGYDYELELVGVQNEDGSYEVFDFTAEYLQDAPAFVLVKGIKNYCDTWAIPVVFEKPIVSFDANGGKPDSTVKVDYNTAVAKPEDPTREGYKFAGWYLDKEGTVAYDFDTLVVEDTQLYAKWVAVVNTGATFGSNMTFIIAGGMILLAVALTVVVLKKRASLK